MLFCFHCVSLWWFPDDNLEHKKYYNAILVSYKIVLFLFFRKLVVYDEWSSLVIHVAMDNTVIEEDISKSRKVILLSNGGWWRWCMMVWW